MSIADKLRTNLRKVKEGWILFFQDAREQNGKVAKELSEGRILRVFSTPLVGTSQHCCASPTEHGLISGS